MPYLDKQEWLIDAAITAYRADQIDYEEMERRIDSAVHQDPTEKVVWVPNDYSLASVIISSCLLLVTIGVLIMAIISGDHNWWWLFVPGWVWALNLSRSLRRRRRQIAANRRIYELEHIANSGSDPTRYGW